MAVMGRNRFHLLALRADLDAHAVVGNRVERNHRAGAEVADKACPEPGTIGFDRGVQVEPQGQRRADVRVLVADKDRVNILHTDMLGQFSQDLRENLNASRIQQHGLAAVDDHVFVGVDDVVVLFGVPADDHPLMTIGVE